MFRHPTGFSLQFMLFHLSSLPKAVLPFTSPCQLPSFPSQLVPFCQLPYHQVPFICDPAAILSRTEAELIERRLLPSLNLTGCLCPSRPCAQQDRRLGQTRAIALLVPSANIDRIQKCDTNKDNSRSWETFRRRRKSGKTPSGLASATGQFARMALERMLGSAGSRERCDPDLMILYIDSWATEEGEERQPFIARIFRRNLAHLRDLSQVERATVGVSPFEVLLEQFGRALRLANPKILAFSSPPKPTLPAQTAPTPLGSSPQTEPIPSWAIYSAVALVTLALLALILAHCIGRSWSLVNQKKFSTASRMSTRSARTEDMSLQGKGGQGGSSRGMVTFGPGITGGGNSSTSHLKSQLMFRQFSRKTQTSVRTVQSQKI